MLVCVWVDLKLPQHKPKQFRMVVELSISKKVPDTEKFTLAGIQGLTVCVVCLTRDPCLMSGVLFLIQVEICCDLTETKMDLWTHTLASAAFVPLSSAVSLQYGVVAAYTCRDGIHRKDYRLEIYPHKSFGEMKESTFEK